MNEIVMSAQMKELKNIALALILHYVKKPRKKHLNTEYMCSSPRNNDVQGFNLLFF